MALSGLKINKLLPGTNCKECGSSTCMAFAMKLASQKAELSECPYASDEAKEVLGAASEPPVSLVALGANGELEVGGETCLYRHDKTFNHQTIMAVNIDDHNSAAERDKCLEQVASYTMERVGENLTVEMVALTHTNSTAQEFADLAHDVHTTSGRPLILRSQDADVLTAAAAAVSGSGSILASATGGTLDPLLAAAQEHDHALAITGEDLDAVTALAEELRQREFKRVLMEFQTHSLAERFQVNSIARRAALKNDCKELGFPTLSFLDTVDSLDGHAVAVTEIVKYGGVCVLPEFSPAIVAPLLALRQNIYTDPQKPIQVNPGLYPVGEPDAESPVFVTTNFSLTYFIVSGEIENAGLNAWLVVPDCEGMSVLTAWAAGKFSGASIASFMQENDADKRCPAKHLIIPGYVAQISGELEEELPGWTVSVGPQEAADLESYAKNNLD